MDINHKEMVNKDIATQKEKCLINQGPNKRGKSQKSMIL